MIINLAVGGGMYPFLPKDQFGNPLPVAKLVNGAWTDGVQPTIGGPGVEVVWDAAHETPLGFVGVSAGTCAVQATLVRNGQPVAGGSTIAIVAPQISAVAF